MTEGQTLRRPIRSFVRPEGHFTVAQRRALEMLMPRYGVPAGEGLLDLDALFGRTAERWLEIVFGNGEMLASLAVAHPERDFIGIDVHRPGAGALLQRLEAAGTMNVRIVCEDAAAFLAQRIADDSLDAVCLFFPDPWPKKRHHKRRLVQPEFVQGLRRKLKIGAMLYLATDWEDYAEHMLAVLEAAEGFANAAGNGFASEATRAMIRVAFEIEKTGRVEIMCAPENRASARIPARLGFTHEATLKKRAVDTEGVARDLMVWSLFAEDYPASPAAQLAYRAFDCMGEADHLKSEFFALQIVENRQ